MNAQKRRKTKSGQAATKLLKWKYENEMEFLLPYLETRQTHTNLTEEIQELNDVDDEDATVQETPESQDEHEVCDNNNSPSRSSFASVVKKQTPRRSQTLTPSQQLVNIMKENAELRKSRYKNVPKSAGDQSTLDEIDMFFLSMAKTVKRLSPIEQATIKMKICTLISETEIRQMKGQAGFQPYQTGIPLLSSSSSTSTASTSNQPFSSPPSTPFLQVNYEKYGQIPVDHMEYTTFQFDPSTPSSDNH